MFFNIGLENGGILSFAAPVSMEALPGGQLLLSLNVATSNNATPATQQILPTISLVSVTLYLLPQLLFCLFVLILCRNFWYVINEIPSTRLSFFFFCLF